jgi:CHAD domain-containing protein
MARLARKAITAVENDPLSHLRTVAHALNAEVAGCLQKPEVEAVHRVRTGTRRVEATLETILRMRTPQARGGRAEKSAATGAATEDAVTGAAKAWLAQLKKLRRAAGEVRDLDVHREIVAEEFLKDKKEKKGAGKQGDAAGEKAPSKANGHALLGEAASPPYAGAAFLQHQPLDAEQAEQLLPQQAHMLDAWLAERRHARAEKLVRQLEKRQSRLKSAEQEFFTAAEQETGKHRRANRKPAGMLALEDFLRLVDEMPVLEADNLHDFRKGAKKARYVAEAGGEEPFAEAIAKAIKRIQDVIGDWHDWLVLGEEAAEALDGDGRGQQDDGGAALRQRIAQCVAQRFARAMQTTDRMRRRLLGEWLAARGKGRLPARPRPPRVTVTATDVARRQSS